MKKMIHFEFKKLVEQKFILILLALLFINVLHITLINRSEVNSPLHRGKNKILDKVEGPFSQEKVNFIQTELNKNKALVEQGDYDTNETDPSTYTGYVFGDMNAFMEIYNDMIRVYNYSDVVNEKLLIQNENLARGHQNHLSTFLEKIWSGRDIHEYYDTSGIQKYLDYSNSTLFSFAFIIFISSHYLYYDQHYEMEHLIHATKHGKNTLKYTRYTVLSIATVVVVLSLVLSDLIGFVSIFRLNGLLNPIYSVQGFQLSSLNISILLFMFLKVLVQIIFGLLLALFMMYLSKIIRSNYVTTVLSFIFAMYMWLKLFSLFNATSLIHQAKQFSIFKLGSYYIQNVWLMFLGPVFIYIFLSFVFLSRREL